MFLRGERNGAVNSSSRTSCVRGGEVHGERYLTKSVEVPKEMTQTRFPKV